MLKRNTIIDGSEYKVYACVDVVSSNVIGVFSFENDASALRGILPVFIQRYPLKDLQIYCVGKCNIKVRLGSMPSFVALPTRLVSKDSYKFPENPSDNLKELNLSPSEIDGIFKERFEKYKEMLDNEIKEQNENLARLSGNYKIVDEKTGEVIEESHDTKEVE